MPSAANIFTPPTPSSNSWRMRYTQVAAIESRGKVTIFAGVAFDIGIEQQQEVAADRDPSNALQ